jgi:glyoxylase-like metal-dependent hydrolase (beta-lactamase superfamily II)
VTGAPDPLDLHHEGLDRVIGVYLLETEDGLALQDCGPSTDIPALKAGLVEHGLVLTDIRHLLLSHIHLDHAGAAGTLVREHPGLQVHVSEIGAPHLVDPSRLERSARRLYGDDFDRLWGELAPVQEANVHVVGSSVLGLECFQTPGHAAHHVCYLDGDGTLYAGDAAGVRIMPERPVWPVSPPPEVDLDAWERTIDELELRAPERLALIHFGVVDQPRDHLRRLRRNLRIWSQRVRQGLSEDEFVEAVREDLEEEAGDAPYYERAAPLWQSFRGLKRYWDKAAT